MRVLECVCVWFFMHTYVTVCAYKLCVHAFAHVCVIVCVHVYARVHACVFSVHRCVALHVCM